jgi:predicted AAA+ superfamily ATPase
MLKEPLAEILRSQKPPVPLTGEVARVVAGDLALRDRFALVLTGVRRCGKSTLQAQLMRRSTAAFYCNFDDIRLAGMREDDLAVWLDVFREIAPAAADVFLDEVQEVEGWQRLVRTLLDLGRKVCVTGSNASLLGADLGRKLTGRHESRSIWPFCYSEYLAATGSARGAESLRAFLDDGGFPGYLRDKRDTLLNELAQDVLQRDVMSRNKLRDIRHVRNLFLFLAANTGLPISQQKLTKNLGIPSAGETARYLDYLQDAYLVFAVPKYSASFKQRVVAAPKYYLIDTGMRRVVSPQPSPELGRRLENAVALEFMRRGRTPCHASERDAWECDFVAQDAVWQVCWQLTEENLARELRGLREARAQSRAKRMLILTLDQKQTLKQDGEAFDVLPAWEWLG